MYYQKFIDKQMRYASNNTLSSVNLDLFLFNILRYTKGTKEREDDCL